MIGLIFLAFLASVCMVYVGFNGDSNIVCFLGIFCGVHTCPCRTYGTTRYDGSCFVNMWEELLGVITDCYYPLESMQENVAGYIDPDKGWDLTRVNPWFTEHGYEFVGIL